MSLYNKNILPPNLAELLVELIEARANEADRGTLYNLWFNITQQSNFEPHHAYMIELIGEF